MRCCYLHVSTRVPTYLHVSTRVHTYLPRSLNTSLTFDLNQSISLSLLCLYLAHCVRVPHDQLYAIYLCTYLPISQYVLFIFRFLPILSCLCTSIFYILLNCISTNQSFCLKTIYISLIHSLYLLVSHLCVVLLNQHYLPDSVTSRWNKK